MTEPMQLTLDGGEVPHRRVVDEARISATSRSILRIIAAQGYVRPRQVESAHGSVVLRRLARRGLVRHFRYGIWVAAE